jgi:hypothetical protein
MARHGVARAQVPRRLHRLLLYVRDRYAGERLRLHSLVLVYEHVLRRARDPALHLRDPLLRLSLRLLAS